MRPPSRGEHNRNHKNPRKLLLALATSFFLPFVVAQAQQQPQSEPRGGGGGHGAGLSSASTGSSSSSSSTSPYEGDGRARHYNTDGSSSRDAYQRRHRDSHADHDRVRALNKQPDQEEHQVATLAPALAVRAPAERPLQQSTSSASGAGIVSPHPARSLDDWEVEDFVLLATVDGALTATDRKTGNTIWTINADRPMVETRHFRPQNESDEGDELDIYKWVWSVEPRGDGQIFIWAPESDVKEELGGLHRTGLSMKTIVEELTPYAQETGNPPLVYTGSKATDVITVDASNGKVIKYLGHASDNFAYSDASCKYSSQFDTECSSRGIFTFGRTQYTVTIHDKNTGRPIAQLNYSEWTFNQANRELAGQNLFPRDNRIISGKHNGQVYSFDHTKSEAEALFTKMLSSPVASVFDIFRPRQSSDQKPELLAIPQPVPLSEQPDVAYARQNSVFLNQTEEGGWYALPAKSYPLIMTAPRAPISKEDVWSSEPWNFADFATLHKTLVGMHSVHLADSFNQKPVDIPSLPGPGDAKQIDDAGENEFIEWNPNTDVDFPKEDPFTRFLNKILSFIKLALRLIWDLLRNPLAYMAIAYTLYMSQNPLRDLAVKRGWLEPLPTSSKIVEEVSKPVGISKELDLADDAPVLPARAGPEPDEHPVPEVAPTVPEKLEIQPTSQDHEEVVVARVKEEETKPSPEISGMPPEPQVELKVETAMTPTKREETKKEEKDTSPTVKFADDVVSPEAPTPEQPTKKKARRGKRGGVRHKKGPKPREMSQSNEDEPILTVDEVVDKALGSTGSKQSPLQPDLQTVTDGKPEDLSGPLLKLNNNLEVNEDEQLGTGSNGTVVFAGKFDGRAVAVKRMLIQFYDIASQETKLLRESDDHPNVIRYYAQTQTGPFLYIALELCKASLADVVDRPGAFRALATAGQQNIQYVLCQVAEGLRFLHDLRIVHRDLKPHNILVNLDRDGLPRIMVSDFGLCKKLEGGQSSFGATTAHAAGTSGWRAPELLLDDDASSTSNPNLDSVHSGNSLVSSDVLPNNRRVTRSIDIFSLGLVYFYVLTGGQHPFDCGDRYMREVNIRKGNYNLEALQVLGDDAEEATQLIGSMLQSNHKLRPTARDVLAHPFFWPNKKKLDFLCDVSDHFEKEPRDPPSPPLAALERLSPRVIPSQDFLKQLPQAFIDSLGKQRKYTGSRMLDLLRAIRNKKNHYEDMAESLRKTVGPLPDGYLHFWTTRFPALLIAGWQLIFDLNLEESERFAEYYKPTRPDAGLWR